MTKFRGSALLLVLCRDCRKPVATVQRLPGTEGDWWVQAHPQHEGFGGPEAVRDAKASIGGRVTLPGQTTRLDFFPPPTVKARCTPCDRAVECAVLDVVTACKENRRRPKQKPLLV